MSTVRELDSFRLSQALLHGNPGLIEDASPPRNKPREGDVGGEEPPACAPAWHRNRLAYYLSYTYLPNIG